MRIVLLEQQSETDGSNSIANGSNSMSSSSSLAMGSEMQKLNKIEYEAAMLRTELGSNQIREEQILKLQHLLNQKDYELQEKQKANNFELDQLNKALLKVKEQLNEKGQDVQKEKAKSLALQRDFDRLQSEFEMQLVVKLNKGCLTFGIQFFAYP